MGDFIINKLCYEACKNVSWSMKDVTALTKEKDYFSLSNLSPKEILVKGYKYARRVDYLDRCYRAMERKNGKNVAIAIFQSLFPKYTTIDDLYNSCFRLCASKKNLLEVQAKTGIPQDLIKYYARQSKLGILEEDKKSLLLKQQSIKERMPEYYNAIMFLISHDKKDEIIEYFSKTNFKFYSTKLMELAYVLFQDKSYDELRHLIAERYVYWTSRNYNNTGIADKTIEKARKSITSFIDSQYHSVSLFCYLEDIPRKTFARWLRIIGVYDKELYAKYKEKLEKIENKELKVDISQFKSIIDGIINGIEGREFTIVDFYSLADCDLDTFYYSVRNSLEGKTLFIIRNFWSRHRNMELLTEEAILSENLEINCLKDKKKTPIIGTGHVVTEEEKKEIIMRILNDGYSLYQPIYNHYLMRYFEEKGVKVKKKSLNT